MKPIKASIKWNRNELTDETPVKLTVYEDIEGIEQEHTATWRFDAASQLVRKIEMNATKEEI